MGSKPRIKDAKSGNDWGFAAKRRGELVRLAGDHGSINAADIAREFSVSPDTIRRDLSYLAKRGLLKRTHGGAVPSDSHLTWDLPVSQRTSTKSEEKLRIARAAASRIGDGEALFVYGGSTTRAFLAQLGGCKDLTVVTNDLEASTNLPPNACRALYVLGGHVLRGSQVTVGSVAFADAGPLSGDTTVLSVGGITEQGLSTSGLSEAVMMAAMMSATQRVIVLADSSKLGRTALGHVSGLDKIDLLVSDSVPPASLAAALKAAGVELLVAK